MWQAVPDAPFDSIGSSVISEVMGAVTIRKEGGGLISEDEWAFESAERARW